MALPRHSAGCKSAEARAISVKLEDAMDQLGFIIDNDEVICGPVRFVYGTRISQRLAAGRAAALRLAGQTPAGRIGDTHSLLLADHALHAQHEMVDYTRRHGVQHGAVEAENLAHMLEMFLVAAQAIAVPDDHYIDLMRGDRGEQLLQRRPFYGCAGNAIITSQATNSSPFRSA